MPEVHSDYYNVKDVDLSVSVEVGRWIPVRVCRSGTEGVGCQYCVTEVDYSVSVEVSWDNLHVVKLPSVVGEGTVCPSPFINVTSYR